MTALTSSLQAYRNLNGKMTSCSWSSGWRSLLLRGYDDPRSTEAFDTAVTEDQLFVLVTDGACEMERRTNRGWDTASYRPGSLGMTPAGQKATLRWRGETSHSTLQLHLPAMAIREAAEALWGKDPARLEMPQALNGTDLVLQQAMLALHQAAEAGAPDIYAESAAAFLSVHVLRQHARLPEQGRMWREDIRLRRVDDYMHANLSQPISLARLAEEAGLSRFHLVRTYKVARGETPFKRLHRMRMELAKSLLESSELPVTGVAFSCGYEHPAHFASAFKRFAGLSPSGYRNSRA